MIRRIGGMLRPGALTVYRRYVNMIARSAVGAKPRWVARKTTSSGASDDSTEPAPPAQGQTVDKLV